MADNGYDLGTGYLQATVSFDGVGHEIGREMRKLAQKEGKAGGQVIGKAIRQATEKETAKVDLGAYETAVKGAEQRVAKHTEDSSKRVEAAKRKVEIARAKEAKALAKYEEGSAEALEATDKLIAAQEKLAATQESVTVEAEGLNAELKKQESLLLAASTAGQKTALSYRASFGKRLTQGISGAITTAFRASGTGAAAAAGALAGTAYGKKFNDSLSRANLGKSVAGSLGRLSGLRVVADIGEQIGTSLRNVDRNVLSIADLGLKIGTLGSVAVAATGGVAGLAVGIGRMVTAGLALPGIIAGVVGGVVIFNQAWKDAATVMADVVEAYGGVQDAISNAFWARAEGPLREIAFTLLPIVRDGSAAVAHELGGWAVAISSALGEASSLNTIAAMFEDLRRAVDISGDGIGSLTTGLLGLTSVGMTYLPRLASGFNELSWSFEAWVGANTANGNMWRWIDAGIVEMKALGSILASTGGIIAAVADAARAAGGATGFAGLAAGMSSVEAALSSPVWQDTMTTVFRGAYESLSFIVDGVKSLGPAFISVAPVLAEVMSLMGESFGAILRSVSDFIQHPAVQHGVLEFFSGVRDTIVDLAPTVGVLGDLFGALASMAGQLVYAIGGTLDSVLRALGPSFVGISEGLRPLIPAVSSIAQAIITGAGPAFQTMGRILTEYVIPPVVSVFEWLSEFPSVLGGVGLALGSLVSGFGAFKILSPILGPLIGLLKPLGPIVLNLAKAAIPALRVAFVALGTVIRANPIGMIITALFALGAGLVAAYDNIGWFKDAVNAAWAGIKIAAQWAWDGIKILIGGFVTWLTDTVWPGVQSAISAVGSVFSWLYNNVVIPVWTGIKTYVAAGTAVLMTVADGIVWAYRNLLAPVFTWLKDSVIVPAWNGIKSAVSAAWTWIRDAVLNPLMGFIRGPLADAWNWLRATVSAVWNSIKSAVSNAWNWIRDAVMIPLGRFLRENVGAAWQWLRDKVSEVWSGIKSSVSGAWNWVRDVVMIPAGTFIRQNVGGAWQWLRDKVAAVWAGIKDTISSTWNWVKSHVIDPMVNAVKNTVVSAFEVARDGIRKAWNAIKGIVAKPVDFVINTVIRDGFVDNFNKIAEKFKIFTIDFNGVNLSGYRTGGYTGHGRRNEVAGPVHRDEHVIRSESRRSIEHTSPGLLDAMNRYGASALSGLAGPSGHSHEGPAFAGPSPMAGRSPWLWGGFQNSIANAGKVFVKDRAPGWDVRGAVKAWQNVSAVKLAMGSGSPGIDVVSQPMFVPGWGTGGYGYSTGPQVTLNSYQSGQRGTLKRGIAAHEIGHSLGLGHINAPASIMHPAVSNATWPTEFDVGSLRHLYGHPGAGVKRYGPGDSGDDSEGIISRIISGITKAVGFDSLMSRIPGSGIAVDVMKGAASTVWDGFKGFIGRTIRGSIDTIMPSWADGILPKIFGAGPELHDHGGVLRPGISWVENRTGQNEAILNPSQLSTVNRSIEVVQRAAEGGQGVNFYAPVTVADPDELWETQKKRERWEAALHAA